MTSTAKTIPEWQEADAPGLSERLAALSQPVVLRGLVKHWPAVQAADICSYLRGMEQQGAEVFATKTRPAARGVMGYAEGLTDFNFVKAKLLFAEFIDVLESYRSRGPETPVPSVAAQCARIRDTVPRFVEENRLQMLPASVEPNLWLGNALTVPVHHDHPHNMACVVAGHRRFTLFAPEQIGNLYIGPLEYTPSGAPISLVDPHAPDFERYPRWRDALQAAWVAELGPGDALYIPPLWWHQVQALDTVNLLVNYWWPVLGASGDTQGTSPVASLLQAIKVLNALPAAQREAWAALFEHYVVQREQEPGAHIPEHRQGVLARRR